MPHKFIEKLGAGFYGTAVYKTQDVETNEYFASKIFFYTDEKDEFYIDSNGEEQYDVNYIMTCKDKVEGDSKAEYTNLQTLNKLNLDFIPQVYDYKHAQIISKTQSEEKERNIFIIKIQLLSGPTLRTSWKNNKSWKYVWETLIQAINLVRKLHVLGICHGDVHSENFVWNDGQLMMIDFTSMNSETDFKNDYYRLSWYHIIRSDDEMEPEDEYAKNLATLICNIKEWYESDCDHNQMYNKIIELCN